VRMRIGRSMVGHDKFILKPNSLSTKERNSLWSSLQCRHRRFKLMEVCGTMVQMKRSRARMFDGLPGNDTSASMFK